ncbi:MAG TPA: hypothetical protein VK968_12510 [Roseimicrobium sp.]|nr:hypothetical protein [Roseimicrobium sp.]
MWKRLTLLVLGSFWLTMLALLWRSEFGSGDQKGNAVPLDLVWEKILTAPDNSNLEIRYRDQKVGYCRWSANIGEETATGRQLTDNPDVAGFVGKLKNYNIDFDGSVFIGEKQNRYRFALSAHFSTNNVWQDFDFRVMQRPRVWQLKADAKRQFLDMNYSEGDERLERRFTFDQLKRPERLAQDLGGPLASTLVANGFGNLGLGDLQQSAGAIKWSARNDWMQVGNARFRVYRLQGDLLDRYKIVVFVSRVGEILKIELPNQITLSNDELRLM